MTNANKSEGKVIVAKFGRNNVAELKAAA